MKDRTFIAAVAFVGALALLMLAGNIRNAEAPLYGPPNVDKTEVMSQVESGRLSFEEARFYSPEEGGPDESGPRGAGQEETSPAEPAGGEAEAGGTEERK